MLGVLEYTYLEQMVENGFIPFCILETNPLILRTFTQNLVNGLHLYSKDQVFFIWCTNSHFSKLVTFDWGFIKFLICTG